MNTLYSKNLCTSCQDMEFKLYARKYKVLLGEKQQQQVIIVPTQTILHTYLDVMVVKYVHDIPIIVCSRNEPKQALQRHPFLTDSDNDYIIE